MHAPPRGAAGEDQDQRARGMRARSRCRRSASTPWRPFRSTTYTRTHWRLCPSSCSPRPTAPTEALHFFAPGVDLTVYIPCQLILQHICVVLHLPICICGERRRECHQLPLHPEEHQGPCVSRRARIFMPSSKHRDQTCGSPASPHPEEASRRCFVFGLKKRCGEQTRTVYHAHQACNKVV